MCTADTIDWGIFFAFGRTNTRALSLAFGIGIFLAGIMKSPQVI